MSLNVTVRNASGETRKVRRLRGALVLSRAEKRYRRHGRVWRLLPHQRGIVQTGWIRIQALPRQILCITRRQGQQSPCEMIWRSIACFLALAASTFALPPGSQALYPRAASIPSCSGPSTITITLTTYLSTTTKTISSSTTTQTFPTPLSYVSLGCILDDTTRVMNKTWTKVNSVEECARIGKASGRKYFGMENGNECYVADLLSKNIPSTGCNIPCSSGGASGGCGGYWRLNLYQFSSSSSSTTSLPVSSTTKTSTTTKASSTTASFSQYSTCPPATSTAPTPVSTARVCYDFLCPPRVNATVRPAVEPAYDETPSYEHITCR